MNLSEKRKKFWAECLDTATTPEEDMLIKTIFGFIEKQDKEAVRELKEKDQEALNLFTDGVIDISNLQHILRKNKDEIFGEKLSK